MKYVFFTGMGRSGTKFLSYLLSNTDEHQVVKHEHLGNREFWLLSWYLSEHSYAMQFLSMAKHQIENTYSNNVFIDINSYLQNCVPELREVFKPIEVFHLTRDGRDVIQSIYSRRSDKRTHLMPKNAKDISVWLNNDKFWQICWNWNQTTEKLLSQNTKLIKFENVVSEYEYFSSHILKPLGLNMKREKWEQIRSIKKNKTRSHFLRYIYSHLKGKDYIPDSLPKYHNWSNEQKETFKKMCGQTMLKAGYDI